MSEIEDALNKPDNTTIEDNLTVFQKIINENDKVYLLRIFVNELKHPPLVVTAYKTSKVSKYNLL